MQFIDLQAQYQKLKSRIDNRIKTVLDHGHYIMGPEVYELEEKLADYVGVKHAISCANGTDALQLCMMMLKIQPGDAVFCPTFTFFATAEIVALAGATPVFVDSDERTFNLCPVDLEKQILMVLEEGRLNVKAIIAVDLFGLPANYPEIERVAKKYNLILIEDAAQGFGGEIEGRRAGSFGDIATTSFFPAKPLGCYGDGGAIFTNDDDYAELLRSYRVHGKGIDKYDNIRVGLNSRLDTIQAGILLEKLEVFNQELSIRNLIAENYSKFLSTFFSVPFIPSDYKSSWAQYTLTAKGRDHCMELLSKHNIPSMIYYGTCLHLQTAFSHLGHNRGDFIIAEKLAENVFSLPMHPYLSPVDIENICSVLTGV